MDKCRCGCGKSVSANRNFIRGHREEALNRDTDRLCECGCGKTLPSEFTAQGEIRKFIVGHNRRGATWSEEQREKVEDYWEDPKNKEAAAQAGKSSRPPEWQRGPQHPTWRGGRVEVNTGGNTNYILIRIPPDPDEDHSGHYVYEHILIARKTLGRDLKNKEEVHHINFDGTDNRRENLLICTHSYHMMLHRRIRELGLTEHFRASA